MHAFSHTAQYGHLAVAISVHVSYMHIATHAGNIQNRNLCGSLPCSACIATSATQHI